MGRWDIVFFAEYWLGLELNPFQKKILEETFDSPNNLIVAGNRSGKTWIIAILHIWHGFYKVGLATNIATVDTRTYNTFNISPVSRQAKETFRYVEAILKGNFAWEKDGRYYSNIPTAEGGGLKIRHFITGKNDNLGEMRFANGWIFYSVTTHQNESVSVQGLPAGYISYDECIESKRLASDLIGQISRLGDYGVRHDLVTAWHATELFNSEQYVFHLYKAAQRAQLEGRKPQWYLVTGTYDDNIFIPEDQKEKHKARVKATAADFYDQIIKGKPITGKNKMFDMEVIDHIWDSSIRTVTKDKHTYAPPQMDHRYIISVDWGLSEQGDETVFLVIDYTKTPWVIVNGISERGGDPWDLMAKLRQLVASYNDATTIMDTNALGGQTFKKMLKELRPKSFDSHGKEKLDALTDLQLVLTKDRNTVIVEGEIIEKNLGYGLVRSIYLPMLEEQLSQYQLKDDKLKMDWVSALYQAIYFLWKQYKKTLSGKQQSYQMTMQ